MKSFLAVLIAVLCLTTSAHGQLFSDNFTRETNPGPLTPWTTNANGGNWTVTDGVMQGGLNPTFSYGFAFITNSFANYSVQARIRFPAGGFGGGIGGRLESVGGAHYAAWVYPENATGDSNVLKLIKFSDYGNFTVLQQTNLAAVGTSFHTVKLEFASANEVNAYFDTNTVIGAYDPTPYASGSVSLDFWTPDTGYLFQVDDVIVSALPLVVSNDTYTVVSGLSLKTNAPGVLANDMGGLGPLTAVLASGPSHGTLTLTNNGGFTYTPTSGYVGADSFTYRATDGVSTSSVATVSITVGPNHAPVANVNSYTMVQDTSLTISAPGVLANDTDVDGNSLTAALVSSVAHGTLSLSANGGFTYTPTVGYSGPDSFTYRANDGLSNSTPATVTISVLAIVPLYTDNFTRAAISPWTVQSGNWAVVNNALVGGTNSLLSYAVAYLTNLWTNYSVQATIQLPAGAFGGGIDACLDPATGARYSAWIYPEGSSGGSNTLKLIKFQDWVTFGYNGFPGAVIQSVDLASVGTIAHTLKLACAGNQIAVFLDGALKIIATDTEAQPYLGGSIAADFWTPSSGYQMMVDDVLVASLVNEDSYSAVSDTTLTVAAPGVLANDTEIAGTTLAAVQVSGPAHGILSLNTDGGFTYTPTNGYVGADSFVYQANDGAVNLGTAIVNLSVLPEGFVEGFDGVTAPALPSGWATSKTGAQALWVTRTTTVDTAPNAAYIPDPADIGTSELVSPTIALPLGQARLTFRNNYRLEFDANGYYDGGVLEIKIGAAAFTDILAAGGSFVTNGYDGVLSSAYESPLAGRQAWSGNSGGFVTTVVNLPAAAMGQTIQLRWVCATDNDNGNTVTNGWYIDSISITNCSCACCWNTPPSLPAQADRTVDELTLLTVNNTATDADLPAQTLTYALINPPAGAIIGANTGIITWTPAQIQSADTYVLRTRVTDNGSPALSSTNSFSVYVREVNIPPSLPNIPDQTVDELTQLRVVNTATNANTSSTILGYGLINPPAGASINANGIITWTPVQTQSPTTNVITTVVTNNNIYDLINPRLTATNSFTVVVREVNVPPTLPVISAQTVAALSLMTVTNTATNSNIHSTISGYRLVNPPSGAAISPAGIITWTPTQLQGPSTNTITTVVTNNNPYDLANPQLTATNSFTVYVFSGPMVTLDAATLAAEGFQPTNNAIDPGETVSLIFSLKNVGASDTTNLVATLLATNGVSAPSSPQSYGVLVAGGGAVSKAFSFTAAGTCGDTIVPTLHLQDGGTNVGTLTLSYTMGQPGTVLTQNFDSVTTPALPSGWTTLRTNAPFWYSTNSLSDTTPNSAFTADANSIGINEIDSPAFALPSGSSQLSFRNRYELEYDAAHPTVGWDGGVLEIKIDTAAFTDILAAGGNFISGGYNTTIAPAYGNPLANRQAWSGNSGGYITTVVALPAAAAGKTVQFRWRCGTDSDNSSGTGTGWRIDSIGVSGTTCAANKPPTLPAQTNRTILELTSTTVTNTATDPESPPEVLSYSLAVGPTNASISAAGVITWTPTEEQGPGVYTFTTIVSDNSLPSASATNSFSVTVNESNSAPALTLPADQTISELVPWSANATGSDTDSPPNSLTFELVSGPSGLTVSPAGLIEWTPTEAQGPSTNAVTVRVFDDGSPSLSSTNTFTLVVNEMNSAPTLTLPADQTIDELVAWNGNATGSDTDSPPNSLTFELVSGPSGLTVSPAGVMAWTPAQTQSPGTNTVAVRAFDDGTPIQSTTNSFTLTVREVNVAPSLPVLADMTLTELSLLTVTNTATNANIHSTITGYTLVDPPAGAAIDPQGIITWTPTEAQNPSTNIITTIATNTNLYDLVNPQLTATNSFTVVVNATEAPVPEIQSINISNAAVIVTWSTVSGRTYRLQSLGALGDTNWNDVPPDVLATGSTASATNSLGAATQQFYRVRLIP